MHADRLRFRLPLAVLFLCLAAFVKPAGAAELIPHRAVYELSLKSGGHGEISDVAGTIDYELQDTCDGWAVSYRMDMVFVYQAGTAMEFGMTVASWESKDGRRYRFFVKRLEGDQVSEEFRGEAELDESGAGRADYSLPEEKTVLLPPGTLFPTAHSLRVLDIVAHGERFFWSTFFDGSDAEGVYGVNTVVADRKDSDAAIGKAWPLLAGTAYSSVQLAFFRSGEESELPESEQRLQIFDNGITSELILDYGNFDALGKLKELKLLKPSC